ncbi:MAG: endolytic transglycosylase MltG [Bacteroidota bacterium]
MKKRGLITVTAFAGLALVITTFSLAYVLFLHPNVLVNQPNKQLKISHGTSFKALKDALKEQGYVSNLVTFSFFSRLMHYDRKIVPGAYQLTTNMSNWAAIRVLKRGTQQPVKIVLHYVRNKSELATQITQNIEASAADFKKLLDDPVFVGQYGFHTDNVMAMFIPNTYEVYWTISPKRLFERMYKEYQKFWNTSRCSQASSLKIIPIEVAILASIVQSETNKLEEAPLIAGVYMNRLRKNMFLQSCPTLLYALEDASIRRVLHKHKDIDSPYNTYKYRGLPPGPICLPSIAMIDAVLNSADNDYLYFSAKEDFSGYHYFASSLKEHSRNARRYQQALNKARIYR